MTAADLLSLLVAHALARDVIATISGDETKGVMALVDVLSVLAGEPPPYANTG